MEKRNLAIERALQLCLNILFKYNFLFGGLGCGESKQLKQVLGLYIENLNLEEYSDLKYHWYRKYVKIIITKVNKGTKEIRGLVCFLDPWVSDTEYPTWNWNLELLAQKQILLCWWVIENHREDLCTKLSR